MSVFCSSSPSTANSLITKVASRQLLPFLYPSECLKKSRPRTRRVHTSQSPVQMVSTTAPSLEAWFIKSLASASKCQKHRSRISRPTTFLTSQRPALAGKKKQGHNIAFQRQQSTHSAEWEQDGVRDERWNAERDSEQGDEKRAIPRREPNRTKEELMELVDQYSGESYTDQLPLLELPDLYQPGDGPNLIVSDKVEDEWPPPFKAWPADSETKAKLNALDEALQPHMKDIHDPEAIYQLYALLPGWRAPYLESRTRHRFLRALAQVEKKDEHSMLRYMSVVDDMKNSAIPLNTYEWNTAISFVARYVNRSTEVEVEAALHMWREMEHEAKIKSNSATFNILFDVACKAGKFTLADMIYKEMESRNLRYDRFHHVSLIHYQGLRRNGDGARAAYKTMVERGEIVDTIVLNAMISALVQSREPNAAENIYERMKAAHLKRGGDKGTTTPPTNFRKQRAITQNLKRIALLCHKYPEQIRIAEFQQKSIISPNLHTYRILINYFAVEAGELDKVSKFLAEMAWFNVPVHGALFLALLKGFALHGGVRYTHWTTKRLESVWRSYLNALDVNTPDLYISRWTASWALHAFAKCEGQDRMLEVWEDLRKRWKPEGADLDFIMQVLRRLTMKAESDKQLEGREWALGGL
ncbi:pentatricopeptide repeat-containing protein-like protein [Tricladium varicosporioides]|nr:pentatricopeptide repeat-containing protein-like protein [Hymenoscyphus varicosporioides]